MDELMPGTAPSHDREAWNVACLRLEDFLRAHRIHSRERLLHLTVEIIAQARARHGADHSRSPLEVTMEIATNRAADWFSRLVESGVEGDSAATRGKVAYFAGGLHRRWPEAFLDPDPPLELLDAVRRSSVQAGPSMEFSSLIRKEINYGAMEDLARETWGQFSWGHVFRVFLIWVVIFFLAYGVWTRFFA